MIHVDYNGFNKSYKIKKREGAAYDYRINHHTHSRFATAFYC